MYDLKKLPANLLNLRKKAGKQQKDVAKAIGITAAALSAYEKGKKQPSLDYAIKLAKHYGISLDVLCGDEEPTEMPTSENAKILQELEDICGNERLSTYISVESVSWHDYKGLDEYTMAELQAKEDQYGVTDEYKVATIKIYNPTIGEFLGQYEKFLNMYRNGDIDADMFKYWKKKYYERLENAEKAPDDKMK